MSEESPRASTQIVPLAGAPDPAQLDQWIDWRTEFPELRIWDPIDDDSEGSGGGFIRLNRKTRDRMCEAAAAGKARGVIAGRAGVQRRSLKMWLDRGEANVDALEQWEEEGCIRPLTEAERRSFICADLYRRFEIAISYGEDLHTGRMLAQGAERNDFRAELEFNRANYDGWKPSKEMHVEHSGEVKAYLAPAADLVDKAYNEFREADKALEDGETIEGTATEIPTGGEEQ